MMELSPVHKMRSDYRELVMEWESARSDPKRANSIFDRHHSLFKQIRESKEGRAAILGLLDDPVEAVRLMAAGHSLAWEPERATKVLEELVDSNSLHGLTAKHTLKAYQSNKLDLDW